MKELLFNEGFILLVIIILYYIKFPERLPDTTIRKDKEISYGKQQQTLQGYTVKSYGEKAIADWLYEHEIDHVYEPKLFGLRPDFFIPDQNTVIEYWGLAKTQNKDGDEYRQKMIKKRSAYAKKQVYLIDILPEDIHSLDKKLKGLRKIKMSQGI